MDGGDGGGEADDVQESEALKISSMVDWGLRSVAFGWVAGFTVCWVVWDFESLRSVIFRFRFNLHQLGFWSNTKLLIMYYRKFTAATSNLHNFLSLDFVGQIDAD